MDDLDLREHRPSEAARRRAAAAGLELDRLKHDDPQTYAMLNAERALVADSPLRGAAGEVLTALFPDRRVFDLPLQNGMNRHALLVFPPLGSAELGRLDDLLAGRVAQEDMTARHAYYRTVTDIQGERRELGIPRSPEAWQGEAGVMVGPFGSEGQAASWAEVRVSPGSGLVADVMAYGAAWFCDVFTAE